MTERSSKQKRQTWTVRFGAAVVWIAIGVGWRGFSLPQSALAEESPGRPPKAQRLPDDLVGVSDAKYASLDGLAAGSREAQERQLQAVQQLGLPLEVKTRKTGIVLRLVPAGSFWMGSHWRESGRPPDEGQHQVTLTEAFYCGKFEVTQGQWEQVMRSNPSYFRNDARNLPVESVSLGRCHEFAEKLCRIEGVAKGTYRLLTEAQWEYACRAGTQTAFCDGNDLSSSMANFNGDSRRTTMPVGSFRPNGWGLYDMHGNVWEWCQDWYDDYPPRWRAVMNPCCPWSDRDVYVNRDGAFRIRHGGYVNRGGGLFDDGRLCRSATRNRLASGQCTNSLGLRLARTTPSYP